MVAAAFEEVEGPLELGQDVEVSVAAAFTAGSLPRYLDKHTVDLWPAFPQWWHTSLLWFPSFLLCSFDLCHGRVGALIFILSYLKGM